MEKLVFIHLHLPKATSAARSHSEELIKESYAHFETCQRRLIFLSSDKVAQWKATTDLSVRAGFDLFEDEAAVLFLVETLCGLKSRVIGETEIFGQFKLFTERLAENSAAQSEWIANKEFLRFLFETVKEARAQFISKWGVQSYGAMLRKILREETEVSMVGFGHLAQELLPWLKGKKLNLYVRRPEMVNKMVLADFFADRFTVNEFKSGLNLDSAAIVAAPVPTVALKELFGAKLWIDFRALDGEIQSSLHEAGVESAGTRVLELKDIFLQLERESQKAKSELPLVQAWLADRVYRFVYRSSHRPMGWDDLCA